MVSASDGGTVADRRTAVGFNAITPPINASYIGGFTSATDCRAELAGS